MLKIQLYYLAQFVIIKYASLTIMFFPEHIFCCFWIKHINRVLFAIWWGFLMHCIILLQNLQRYHTMCPKSKDVETKTIELIKQISPEQIITHGKKVANALGETFIDEPTACGTYANSLFFIIPDKILKTIHPNCTVVNIPITMILDFMNQLNNTNERMIIRFCVCSGIISFENGQNVFFPGHAFTIIRIDRQRLIFTQSYVNQYYHNECVESKTYEEVLQIVNDFYHFTQTCIIDGQFVEAWQRITRINANDWKNGKAMRENNSKETFLSGVYKMSF